MTTASYLDMMNDPSILDMMLEGTRLAHPHSTEGCDFGTQSMDFDDDTDDYSGHISGEFSKGASFSQYCNQYLMDPLSLGGSSTSASTSTTGGKVIINTFVPHEPNPSLDFLQSGASLRRNSSPHPMSIKEKRARLIDPAVLTVDTTKLVSMMHDPGLRQLESGMNTLTATSPPRKISSSSSSVSFSGISCVSSGASAPASSEDGVIYYRDESPEGNSEGDSSFNDDSQDDDDYDLPPAPNTKVIDNKPRRGGRHKKDGKPREELMPPPSPHTLNDPELMQEYRQERNRLAAKRSRERKKDYIGRLEATCKALKSHNDEISKELHRLKKDLSEVKGKVRRRSITTQS